MKSYRTPIQNRVERVRTSLRAGWAREDLDRRLAEGADPDDDSLLRVNAERLVRPRARAAIAAGLEGAVASAHEVRRPLAAGVPVRRAAVRGADHELMRLAGELRHMPDPRPQGVAMAERLLIDVSSPLYTASSTAEIASAACTAANHMRQPGPDAGDRSTACLTASSRTR